jgi:hypothetical protein
LPVWGAIHQKSPKVLRAQQNTRMKVYEILEDAKSAKEKLTTRGARQ